ncbi:ATP-dependent helicase [Kiritimatiellaeota bacterium B1221]|nr:ATP-dependent helicase [Kiritimatiellaeota bacterium B1221]
MNTIDFASELNEEQLAAVQAGDGPVLIIAAAGTGKTRTLIYRVAYLVEKGVRGENILLLTFTNKAAAEMMERARDRVGPEPLQGMWGGTFHSIANRILRLHADKMGYRTDYTIIDSDDQKSLMKNIYDELGHKGDKEFPKPQVLLSLFSLALNKDGELQEMIVDRFADQGVDIEAILKIQERYAARKKELNALDFDDLLVQAVRMLEENEGPREYYQQKFRYVMVDEYQDTNPVQSRFVDLLSGGSNNLLVVGDDFQSIYGWRGADYRNILDFPEKFPDAQVFKLVTNYRSVPGVLRVANKCIAGNPEQFQKELRAVRPEGVRPIVAKLNDGRHQSQYMVNQFRMMQRAGYQWKDMCVLYRAHYHAMELQLELNREGIPYSITSGVRFFEQAHIKDVLCLLRLAQNPRDELAFVRLLSLLPGVAEKGARNVWKKISRKFNPLASEDRKLLKTVVPKRGQAAWEPVHEALEQMEAEDLTRNPGEMVFLFLESFYEAYANNQFDNAKQRMEDIHGMAEDCGNYANLEDFMNELALQTNLDEQATADGESANAIRLCTIHQSKGLEFPVVAVLWCADGMFPSTRSMEDGDGGGESEERRLFYVAVTRAKDRLIMGMPQMRRQRDGGMIWYQPSRFISELGPGFLDEERGGYY